MSRDLTESPLDRRPLLRVPDPTASEEERQQALNEDLPDLWPQELFHEAWRAARIAARNPRAFVWIGPDKWLSARAWANERVRLIVQRLVATRDHGREQAPPRRKVTSWLR